MLHDNARYGTSLKVLDLYETFNVRQSHSQWHEKSVDSKAPVDSSHPAKGDKYISGILEPLSVYGISDFDTICFGADFAFVSTTVFR